ncbi:MAG: hypothetical protein ACNI27_07710 [Desulfovibrio sp.]
MTAPVSPDGKPVLPPTPVEKTQEPDKRAVALPWDITETPQEKIKEQDRTFEAAVYDSVYTGRGGLIDEIA